MNIGLVLSGGMAKGAYQIGALKALNHFIPLEEIKYISCASIGVLNGYAYATESLDRAEKMWKNIFNSKKLKNSEEKEKEMVKQNESETDKNALKNRIMEHINKAVKGESKVDGENEDSWYKELREMLDKLAYTESEDKKSNSDEEDDKEEDKKDNKCHNSEEEKDEKENESDSEEDKKDSDDSEESDKKDNEEEEEKSEKDEKDNSDEEEDKKDVKDNSKDLNRLHNSGSEKIKTGYESEKARLALGNKLF